MSWAKEIKKIKKVLYDSDETTTLESIILQSRKIIDEEKVPLDGDATQLLVDCLLLFIDLHEGNITEKDYNKKPMDYDDDPAYVCPACGKHGDAVDSDFGEASGERTFQCTNKKCEAEWVASYSVKYLSSEEC